MKSWHRACSCPCKQKYEVRHAATRPDRRDHCQPASGRDLRRLTANAGLYSSTDKASAIQRLLAAFGATGVGQVLLPSDMTGIAAAVLKASQVRSPVTSIGQPSKYSTCR